MTVLKDNVLALLVGAKGSSLSGETMSSSLGVSRAAVWKAVEALRQEGYQISSAPHRGYVLEKSPDRLSAGVISASLAGRLVGREIVCLDTVDSTNEEVKRRAAAGAPTGLAVLAETQTGGKGRRGRSFQSPAGQGLYLSVLLRPHCPPEQLFQITAWTAVAVCDGIAAACGIRPGIKWTNDLVLNGKKLCGILTELGLEGESGAVDYVAVGIGINVSQTSEDFIPEVRGVATSLAQALTPPPARNILAAAVLAALDDMYASFPAAREEYLKRYRAGCLTLGRPCRLLRADGTSEEAFAEDVDDSFSLIVRCPDGNRKTVFTGEVSVRGLFGYAD